MSNYFIASTKCVAIYRLFFFLAVLAVVGCGDDSSSSTGPNDEPGVESSSSSGKVTNPAEVTSSSSEKAKSSSSDTPSDAKQSSSSEKTGKSSSSVDDASSSSVKSESSSPVEDSQSSSSDETSVFSSSVSELLSSSSKGLDWSLPKETYLNPEIEYDTIIDSRDGKVYKTVEIGDQTWMAENLNFDPGQGGSGEDEYEWSWCYNNEPKNCDVAGRLYTWAAAMDSAGVWSANGKGCGFKRTCSPTYPVRGVCPEGWHLPSQAEWKALLTAVGGQSSAGKVLKSQSGWYENGNGTDAFGFSALPAGDKYYKGDFSNEGRLAELWSSTEYNNHDTHEAYHMDLSYEDGYANLCGYAKYYGESVRCVKD